MAASGTSTRSTMPPRYAGRPSSRPRSALQHHTGHISTSAENAAFVNQRWLLRNPNETGNCHGALPKGWAGLSKRSPTIIGRPRMALSINSLPRKHANSRCLMVSDYKIVVAHPDDEILFFNSILANSKRAIVCFGPSASRTVSEGRKRLREEFPFENVRFLWLEESDVLDPATFHKQSVVREGLTVSRNAGRYRNNFDELVSRLRTELNESDTVFTHNPWGEYGHEEHVQVFNAVFSLKEELRLNIYVSSYVSNRSWGLMKQRHYLLGREALLGSPSQAFGQQYMDPFIKNNCWTWPEIYTWPSTELFFSVNPDLESEVSPDDPSIAYLPLNMLSWDFTRREPNKVHLLLKKIVPQRLKKLLKPASSEKKQ